jgi:hypothetical protein
MDTNIYQGELSDICRNFVATKYYLVAKSILLIN